LPLRVWTYTEKAVGHQHNYIYFGLLGTLWIIVFNHLYFLVETEKFLVLGLGAIWSLIFANAYLVRRGKKRKPEG
jgi:hypothetical protein